MSWLQLPLALRLAVIAPPAASPPRPEPLPAPAPSSEGSERAPSTEDGRSPSSDRASGSSEGEPAPESLNAETPTDSATDTIAEGAPAPPPTDSGTPAQSAPRPSETSTSSDAPATAKTTPELDGQQAGVEAAGEDEASPGEKAVAPDITVAGGTDGKAEAKVGVAWFIPGDTVQHTVTLAGGVEVKDGVGRLFSFSEDDGPSVAHTWTVGLSYGLILPHDGKDLVPDGKPLGNVGIPEMEAAYDICHRTCAGRKEGGCDTYKTEVETLQKYEREDTRGERLQSRWSDVDDSSFPELTARVQRDLPSSHAECSESKIKLASKISELASATGDAKGDAWSSFAEALEKTAATCVKECSAANDGGTDCRATAKFNSDLLDHKKIVPSAADFDRGSLCQAGEKLIEKKNKTVAELRRISGARYPRWQFSFGANGGLSPHKFLRVDPGYQQEDDAGDPVGMPYTRLVDENEIRGAATAGFSFAHVHVPSTGTTGLGLTWEVLAIYGLGWDDSTTTAKWCEAQAGVVGDEATGPTTEACSERAYGPPTRTGSGRFESYLGWVETARPFFRFAVGGRYAVKSSPVSGGRRVTNEATLRAPLSFNLTVARRKEGKLDYDGVIRIIPFVGYSRVRAPDSDNPGETKSTDGAIAGLNFVLLGKRSLFSTRFDQL